MKSVSLLLVLGLSVATVATSCGGKKAPENPVPNADSAAAADRARQDSIAAAQAEADRLAREEQERLARQREADSLAALSRGAEEVRNMLATMIHFDLDKSNIRSDDMGALDQKVAILQANPDLRIRVGGHCDERGSDEYNINLGQRRAQEARKYLVDHGIDAGRIDMTSNGEQRPVCQEHDESCWSQNRRDEFVIVAGGDNIVAPR